MRHVRRLLVLALFVGLFYVAWEFRARNPEFVGVDLLVWQAPPVPKWVLLLTVFGLGALLASLALSLRLVRSNLVARRYRKSASRLESEIHQLRNLPLAGEEADVGRTDVGA